MNVEQTDRSETSVHKIQMPGNHPKDSIQHAEYGESFKSRIKQHVMTKRDYPGV